VSALTTPSSFHGSSSFVLTHDRTIQARWENHRPAKKKKKTQKKGIDK
jgi:hypothetical protein